MAINLAALDKFLVDRDAPQGRVEGEEQDQRGNDQLREGVDHPQQEKAGWSGG
jgi:hypothetical protein